MVSESVGIGSKKMNLDQQNMLHKTIRDAA